MKTIIIVIALLGVLILLNIQTCRLRQFKSDADASAPDTVKVIRTEKYDSIIYKDIDKPVPFKVVEYIDRYPDIDSMAVFAAFYRKNIYHRVLMDDSIALIELVDTVFMNELLHGVVKYKNRRPIVIHETYIVHPAPEHRNVLYLGGTVQGNLRSFDAGGSLMLKTRGNNLYGLGYSPFSKTFQVHMLWPLYLCRDR